MNHDPAEAARAALAICEKLGFAEAGIAEASPSKWGPELRAWLDAGKHGSMEYLAKHVEARLDPGRVLGGAKSVVMVADLYAARDGARAKADIEVGGADFDGTGAGTFGRIARYSRGRDYHVVMKKRLHELADRMRAEFGAAEFRAFVDTAPVLEREYAARAGLGWIGKHTLLIHPRRGSYFLLGGVLTTVEMAAADRPEPDHCGTCTRCIDACPTKAITPYSVDASRCISYLTIERRGEIAPEFHERIGEWAFGCDVCQEVCPHNSPRADRGYLVRAEYEPLRQGFDVLAVLGWTEEDRRREFQSSALKRATLAMMKRNALIVAGNIYARSGAPEVLARVREVSQDDREPDIVRLTAVQVLKRFDTAAGAV